MLASLTQVRTSWRDIRNDTVRLDLLVLYAVTFVFGFTSIAHENNLGALGSYIVGNTATEYGIVIGATMLGIGVGFYLSRLVSDEKVLDTFVYLEVLLTLVAGLSAVIAFWSYANVTFYVWVIRGLMVAIAVIVGLEDALLVRYIDMREPTLARALGVTVALSSIGGAIAGFIFGTLLLPHMGLLNIALVLGLVDAVFVFICIGRFKDQMKSWKVALGILAAVAGLLFVLTLAGKDVSRYITQPLYDDPIKQEWGGSYGAITLTADPRGYKLFIGGNLQFSSKDEHMYHELIVHPAMSLVQQRVVNRPLNVLVAGGGDGLVARELLKYEQVEKITVVDLNPVMTSDVAVSEPVVSLNQGSLLDPNVTVVNDDAYLYLRDTPELYDLIVVDLVDPSTQATAKLYTYEFYQFANNALTQGGMFITQSASPHYTTNAFWTINLTLEEVFPTVVPFRWAVPSFGDWGWNIASNVPFDANDVAVDESKTTWLSEQVWQASQAFGKTEWEARQTLKDLGAVSTLDKPEVLIFYIQKDAWDDWGD